MATASRCTAPAAIVRSGAGLRGALWRIGARTVQPERGRNAVPGRIRHEFRGACELGRLCIAGEKTVQRVVMDERPGWRQQAESFGFRFHSIGGVAIGMSRCITDSPCRRSKRE